MGWFDKVDCPGIPAFAAMQLGRRAHRSVAKQAQTRVPVWTRHV